MQCVSVDCMCGCFMKREVQAAIGNPVGDSVDYVCSFCKLMLYEAVFTKPCE